MNTVGDTLLAIGNSAKLYCLKWIEREILTTNPSTRIVDLGCGDGSKFEPLLHTYPTVRYTGIEPDMARAQIAHKRLAPYGATIIAENTGGIDRRRPDLVNTFDVAVSFSVLEHVYDRAEYFRIAHTLLADEGYFLLNVDSGHFFDPRQRLKTIVGQVLAQLGNPAYYQRFVSRNEFEKLIDASTLSLLEMKLFNMASFKRLYKCIAAEHREAFMQEWLMTELALNNCGIKYTDELASLFLTRNIIMQK